MPCPCQGNNNNKVAQTPGIKAPILPQPPKLYSGAKFGNWTLNGKKTVEKTPSKDIFVFNNPVEQREIPASQNGSVIVTVVNSDDPQLKEFASKNSISMEKVNSPQKGNVVQVSHVEVPKIVEIPKPRISMNMPTIPFLNREVKAIQGNKISTRKMASNVETFSIEDIPVAQVNPKVFREPITKKKISTRIDKETDLFFGKDPY